MSLETRLAALEARHRSISKTVPGMEAFVALQAAIPTLEALLPGPDREAEARGLMKRLESNGTTESDSALLACLSAAPECRAQLLDSFASYCAFYPDAMHRASAGGEKS